MPYLQDLSYAAETRVVLVGTTVCSNDETNLPPLPQVQQNIHYLSRLFTAPDIVGLPPEAVVPILDYEEASAVLTAIARAAEEATDTLIVYYAGHGLYGDANIPLYLATKNTTSATRSFSAVRINDVKSAMRGSRATKRVLILDCCYSGRAFQEGDMAAVEDAVQPAVDLVGTYGIAAAPSDSKALAPPGAPLTKFTQVLVDVLERGIEKSAEVLTLGEVFEAVKADVRKNADMPLPEAINWKEGTQFKLARNRYLKRSGLDEIIKGLQGLREAVTLTGARVEAIELKAAVIEQFAGRLSEAESRIANIGSQRIDTPGGRSLFRRPPLWERVDLSQDQWRRLPAFPFKHNIENYFDERKNIRIILFTIGYLIIATASLMFYGASIIYISNVGHIVFVVVNVLYAILLFLVMLLLVSFGIPRRKYQGVGLSGKIDDEISKELEFNVKLIRAGYGEIPSLFGFPFSMPAGLIPCILGVFGIVSIYFIGYKLSAELGFQPLSITP